MRQLGFRIALLIGLVFLLVSTPTGSSAQGETWSEPINLSNTAGSSWFPDLVVDTSGQVHIIWCETTASPEIVEKLLYVHGEGTTWSTPNDIAGPQVDILRNALAIDHLDRLFVSYRETITGGTPLVYRSSGAASAWSAASWSADQRVGVRNNAYISDLAADSQGVLHLVFDDSSLSEAEECPGCADIYYRRSADGGLTWSNPVNFSRTTMGSGRARLLIDSNDTLHVAWDEGWDRMSNIGRPESGAYTFSTDGGETWAPITKVTYPEGTNAQLTPGSDGHGGVLLVWRATTRAEIFFQWSADGGTSWGTPEAIPGIYARPWTTEFDIYETATDSAGRIHLVVVGRETPENDAPLAVYHLIWDGSTWSAPVRISSSGDYPEYPRIAISAGNRLHVVWFVRDALFDPAGAHKDIWYSSSVTDAPEQTPVPAPTATPAPTLTPTAPPPTITPTPTLPPQTPIKKGFPQGLYTDTDDALRLVIALVPLVALILLALLIRRLLSRRR